MYRLFIHEDADADLERLWAMDPDAAARIGVLLEEIRDDQELLDRLTQHDFGAPPAAPFHVSKWHEQWRRGRDLWRLKLWDLDDLQLRYRVIYAYVPGRRHYHVLAIAHRSQVNYDDPQDPLTRRILGACVNL